MGDPSLWPSALAADPGGDLALIRRCQRRDPAAFGELYEKYVDRVYKHIYYFLRDRADAEDLTAETFLRAWAAVDRYQWRGKPVLSWLLTIAHNLVVSRFRTNRNEGRLHDGVSAKGVITSPEEASVAKLQQEESRRAILKLKPTERQVLLMRFVDGMDYPEVAEALGKTVNAIRVIQFRALSNLRRMVSTQEDS